MFASSFGASTDFSTFAAPPKYASVGILSLRIDLWRTHVVARPKSLLQLGPLTQLQLAIAGARYDGNSLSAQDRLFEANGKPTLFQMFFESSVLVDQHGIAHYDVIRFMVDDALIFRSKTTELVGSVSIVV